MEEIWLLTKSSQNFLQKCLFLQYFMAKETTCCIFKTNWWKYYEFVLIHTNSGFLAENFMTKDNNCCIIKTKLMKIQKNILKLKSSQIQILTVMPFRIATSWKLIHFFLFLCLFLPVYFIAVRNFRKIVIKVTISKGQ